MKHFTFGLLFGALVFLASCGGSTVPDDMRIASADQTVVVTPFDLTATPNTTDWFFYQDAAPEGINNALGIFVAGPGNPPEGDDSVQISTTGSSRPNLATYQFGGTPLADITELGFSTYNPSDGNGGPANRSGYLQFNVDLNGTDVWQYRLIYVPRNNGTVVQDTWQSWDALDSGDALWGWSGYSTTSAPPRLVWPGTSIAGNTLMSWSDILTNYPNARIRVSDPWLGIRVGEPYSNGYTENIDQFIFGTAEGTTTFDFERTAVQNCKDHWEALGFKNRGQCVASFHRRN